VYNKLNNLSEKHKYKSHITNVGLDIALTNNEITYLKRLDIGLKTDCTIEE